MKKLFYLLTMVGFTLLAACNTDDASSNVENTTTADYLGTLLVTSESGMPPFKTEDVHFSLAEVRSNMLTLWMHDTQFVAQMPKMTMAVPDIMFENTATETTLSGDKITPYMGGTPYEKYMITNLKGTLSNDGKLHVSFNCMGFMVTYVGNQTNQ